MATKQQRETAIKRLNEILIEASLANTDSQMNDILHSNGETLFITRFLTINRIKKIRQNLVDKAIENNMYVMAKRLENMFPNIDMK
tara:strand:+ start:132 stop:389 length:258 start_codon:yes stop_codon:yes gene_type:complete